MGMYVIKTACLAVKDCRCVEQEHNIVVSSSCIHMLQDLEVITLLR